MPFQVPRLSTPLPVILIQRVFSSGYWSALFERTTKVSGLVSALLPGGVMVKLEASTAICTLCESGVFCFTTNRIDLPLLVFGFWRIVSIVGHSSPVWRFSSLLQHLKRSAFSTPLIGSLFWSAAAVFSSRIWSADSVCWDCRVKMHVVRVDRSFLVNFESLSQLFCCNDRLVVLLFVSSWGLTSQWLLLWFCYHNHLQQQILLMFFTMLCHCAEKFGFNSIMRISVPTPFSGPTNW